MRVVGRFQRFLDGTELGDELGHRGRLSKAASASAWVFEHVQEESLWSWSPDRKDHFQSSLQSGENGALDKLWLELWGILICSGTFFSWFSDFFTSFHLRWAFNEQPFWLFELPYFLGSSSRVATGQQRPAGQIFGRGAADEQCIMEQIRAAPRIPCSWRIRKFQVCISGPRQEKQKPKVEHQIKQTALKKGKEFCCAEEFFFHQRYCRSKQQAGAKASLAGCATRTAQVSAAEADGREGSEDGGSVEPQLVERF